MKKVIVITILLALIMSCCLTGCIDETKPRRVEVEVINPTTGEVVNSGDTIDIPKEKTKVEVRIKDKETGVYLTDADLPEMTIEDSYSIGLQYKGSDGWHFMLTSGYWPSQSQITKFQKVYEIAVFFDCRPREPKDPKKFKRKYEMETFYIRFYYNLDTEK